ncbi:MAG: hypothetical protein RDV41_04105, partial [Planctomycetota bacterium]|nr:hypothetical protein [Planctomycetota bacterium]
IDGGGPIRVRVGEKQEGMGEEVKEANWKLWDTYPVSYGDGMYTRGEFITLDQGNILQFLEKAGEKGGRLTVTFYFFKSRYYELVLPDEKGK